jgi:Na+/H+ antiporter NhaD/arsenite permease-like protein
VVVLIVVLVVMYRREFAGDTRVEPASQSVPIDRLLLAKSLAVTLGMIVFFFAGWPIAKVAIIAGALLLITRRVHPEQVYAQVDWSLLVLFAGLFIVVAGLEKSSLQPDLVRLAGQAHLENSGVLSAAAAVLSNLVSNVPAVLMFKPFIPRLSDPVLGWLRLAMASTLAGNLTILGSIANLIVVERSRGVAEIGFWEYSRAGIPVGLITIAIGVWMLR